MNSIRIHRFRPAPGFTLVEILAVLVLLAILAAVALPKFGSLQEDAAHRGVDAAIAELNAREKLSWSMQRLESPVPSSNAAMDSAIVSSTDTDLGVNYSWSSGPGATGGTLDFHEVSVALTRTAATLDEPATWSR